MRIGFRELIFMLLLVAMPVASYLLVFQPRSSQIHLLREEIAKKRQKLQELEAATTRFADLGREIDKLSEAIDLFEHKLPEHREEQVILQEVWQAAARHDLLPKSIRPEKPNRTAHYAELPIEMEISGDFDGFYRFLLELEQLSRITRMPEVEMVELPKRRGEVTVKMTLSIFFEARTEPTGMERAASGRTRL